MLEFLVYAFVGTVVFVTLACLVFVALFWMFEPVIEFFLDRLTFPEGEVNRNP
jgi:hypothetical protein